MKIAVDGYSSCGKSTLAKYLAKELGFIFIDTGAMYRAVTLFCLNNNLIDKQNSKVDLIKLKTLIRSLKIEFVRQKDGSLHTFLNGLDVEKQIRGLEVSSFVSPVAAIDFVRSQMVELQRQMASNQDVVMDGRDIGTVVFPDAELKLFVTARPEIRAMRRFRELQAKGESVTLEQIKENLTQRDKIDTTREVSPLKQAEDAVIFDNSDWTIEEQNQKALELVAQRRK